MLSGFLCTHRRHLFILQIIKYHIKSPFRKYSAIWHSAIFNLYIRWPKLKAESWKCSVSAENLGLLTQSTFFAFFATFDRSLSQPSFSNRLQSSLNFCIVSSWQRITEYTPWWIPTTVLPPLPSKIYFYFIVNTKIAVQKSGLWSKVHHKVKRHFRKTSRLEGYV